MNMSKLSDYAKEYVPASTTKNISDLPSVSTDLELIDDEFEMVDKVTKMPKKVTQKVIVINKEQYRVPVSVIQQLKVILEDNPNLKSFKVKRSGTSKEETKYQVIPLS